MSSRYKCPPETDPQASLPLPELQLPCFSKERAVPYSPSSCDLPQPQATCCTPVAYKPPGSTQHAFS